MYFRYIQKSSQTFSEFYSRFPSAASDEVIFWTVFRIFHHFWILMFWFNSRIELLKPCGSVLRILVGRWEVCCGSVYNLQQQLLFRHFWVFVMVLVELGSSCVFSLLTLASCVIK